MVKVRVFAHLFFLDQRDAIRLTSELGIGCEISLSSHLLDDPDAVSTVKSLARDIQCSVHAPIWDMNIGAFDPKIRGVVRHRLLQSVEFAHDVGSLWIVVHTGLDPRLYPEHRLRKWLSIARETLTALASESQIPILVENVFDEPEIIASLIEGVERCYVTLDIGHAHVYSRRSIEDWISTLGEHVREVHLHENSGAGDEHLALGSGYIDVGRILSMLEDETSDFYLTIEPRDLQALHRSIEWLKDHGWL